MKKTVALLLAAASFTVSGCFSEPEPTGPQPVAMTTPAAVLENVEYSWNIRGIDTFKTCLSPNFVFYFNPLDVGQEVGGYKIPVSWGYEEMWHAVANMFDQAYSISLSIPTDKVGTPPPNTSVYRADNVGISLLIYQTEDSGFKVDSGYCNYEFEKYRGDDGKDYWRMTRWWDFTTSSGMASAAGVTPVSLSHILALYR